MPSAAALQPGILYGLPGGGTPFEDARLARYLLSQPQYTGRTVPGGLVRLEIVADTVVPTRTGRERVRLAMMFAGGETTPSGVWLDSRGELFATDVGWFITVRPDAEATLPTLRAIEIAYRNA